MIKRLIAKAVNSCNKIHTNIISNEVNLKNIMIDSSISTIKQILPDWYTFTKNETNITFRFIVTHVTEIC